MTTWSKAPPTEPGERWWREFPDSPREDWCVIRVEHHEGAGLLAYGPFNSDGEPLDGLYSGGEWGPRVPTPDEIAALRAAVASLAVERGHFTSFEGTDDCEAAYGDPGPCGCGADEWNAKVRAARAALGGGPVTDWEAVAQEWHAMLWVSSRAGWKDHPGAWTEQSAKDEWDAAVARHTKGGE